MQSLLLSLSILSPWAQAPGGLDRDALRGAVEPVMEQKRIPGAVIGVVVGDELVLREAFGYRDLASMAPMEPETLFQIGSVTKSLTATLVGILAAEGALRWDERIGTIWTGEHALPVALRPLTLRQLAAHVAGLPREPVNRRNLPESPSVMLPYSRAELHAGLAETELEGAPGAAWAYSNLGYAILGRTLELATGRSYEELLRTRLLEPLGMTDSGVSATPEVVERFAACYWPEDDEPIARDPWEMGEVCAFAGAYSSVDDLARFVAAQYDDGAEAVIGPEARRELHAPLIEIPELGGRRMAPGWFVDELPGAGRLLGHGGEVDGHSACIAFLPEARAGLIVLANQGDDSAESLILPLLGQVLPALLAR